VSGATEVGGSGALSTASGMLRAAAPPCAAEDTTSGRQCAAAALAVDSAPLPRRTVYR
jgi:hypothetical protein